MRSLWTPWTSNVPFDKNDAASHIGYGGLNLDMIGDGEEKFADQIGGLRTLDDTFDVMGVDNIKYEVKKLTLSGDRKVRNFRCSIAGDAVQSLILRSQRIVDELNDVFKTAVFTRNDELSSRFEEIRKRLLQGTVRRYALFGCDSKRNTILGLKYFVEMVNDALMCIDVNKKFDALVGENVIEDISAIKYIRMMKAACMEPIGVSDAEIALSYIDDAAFFNPDEINKLWNSVKPSEAILQKTDFLVLVERDRGFMIVPQNIIDELVVFCGVEYGRDMFFRVVKDIDKI